MACAQKATTTRTILFFTLALLLLTGYSHPAKAQDTCADVFPPLSRITYDDNGYLQVIGSWLYGNNIDAAIKMWNQACGFSALNNSNMPELVFEGGGSRSGGHTTTNSILIVQEPCKNKPGEVDDGKIARWDPPTNTIILCSHTPGGASIGWDDPVMINTIAHEIGHALGLAHDNCGGRLMIDSNLILEPNARVDPAECAAVDRIQSPVCHPDESAAGLFLRRHCPAGCDCSSGYDNPDDPLSGLEPCDFLPMLCPDDSPFPWHQGFYSVDCYSFFSDYPGGTIMDVTCREILVYSSIGLPEPIEASGLDGQGPAITLNNPAELARISGTLTVSGSAVGAGRGVSDIEAWIDNQHVDLGDFSLHLPSSASCAHPSGGTDPDCPNIGFSGTLDTTALSEGAHTLKIVAVDTRNPYPLFTLLERQFIVDNVCDDTQAPVVSISSPSAGAVVKGMVNVSASASDNVGVTKVEFLVNGSLVATDSTAPYSFSWNTASLPDGSRTLQAKAFDACNNSKISATVSVTVQQDASAPQASWTSPAPSAIVRGTISLQAQASDDVGVTRVEFYVNGALQGTDTTAPYAINWNTTSVADGSYSLQAKAFDAAAKSGSSATVTIKVDNTAPRAFVGVPAHNAVVSGTSVQLSGWATDLSRITSLAFKLDSQPVALNGSYTYGLHRQDVCDVHPGDPGCPYVGWQAYFDSTRFGDGSHSLEVVATDGAGLTVTAQRTFNIKNDFNAPTVSITAPANGSTVKGIVTVQASASDNTDVTRVELLVNNVLKGTDTTAPYSFSWDTATAAEGSASVVAKAYDAGGNTGTASISVTVDNLQPKIRIVSGDGVTITPGMTYTFPSTPATTPTSRAFTIYNDGADTLQIHNPNSLVSGTGFSLIEFPPSQIAPGSSGYFRVRLMANNAGTFNGTVSIQNSDLTKNPFTFYVTGTVTPPPAPKIRIVSGDGVTLSPGMTYTFPSTQATTSISRVFTIYNDGNAPLDILNPTSLVSGTGFSLIEFPQSQIAAGSSSYFRVRLMANNAGTFNGTVSVQNNDPTRNPFTFYVTGSVTPAPAPVIRIVSGDGITVGNGSLYTFPSTPKSTPVSRAFTIYNDGPATLTISNPTALVSGTGWSLILEPPGTIAPGNSGVFRVRLLSATAGTYNGSVTIQNNSATNPFSFSLRGTVN